MKTKPIFQKILFPLIALLCLESFILVCGIIGSGILGKIEGNEKSIVEKTVENRKTFFENQMTGNWMNLSYSIENVNGTVQRYLDENHLDITEIDDSSSTAAPVLRELYQILISEMRSQRVTGVFVILNADDLGTSISDGIYRDMPGLYLSDADPLEQGSTKNADLLVKCAPVSVLHEMEIPSDTFWDVGFSFSESSEYYMDFFCKPFQLAYENPGKYKWEDMGYWSAPFEMFDRGKTILTYSVPLTLEDGTVYGVMGIDLSLDYLQTLLPYTEINQSENGAYFLAKRGEKEGVYREIIGDGNLTGQGAYAGGDILLDKEDNFYYETELSIYNNNAPFSYDEWVLVGVVPMKSLMNFVRKIEIAAIIALLVTLIISLAGSILISYVIQRPIARLSKEVKEKNTSKVITLKDTGIKEIDEITDELEMLSRNAFESSKKFTQIIEMASVKMAGFQINKEKNKLFVTENFFEILNMSNVDVQGITIDDFVALMEKLHSKCVERNHKNQYYVFRIQDEPECYVSLKCRQDEASDIWFGLVEDITQALLEKKRIEYERDHDTLTNLYNRRAFLRKMDKLFKYRKAEIKTGAFLMMDLDNLKHINDTYGHKYGDRYIQGAAEALRRSFPENALFARISGDEFNVFIYGYEEKAEIEMYFTKLKENLNSIFVNLPDGTKHAICASGGVAWYPQDSISYIELLQYADDTMYRIKRDKKGDIVFFDKVNSGEVC